MASDTVLAGARLSGALMLRLKQKKMARGTRERNVAFLCQVNLTTLVALASLKIDELIRVLFLMDDLKISRGFRAAVRSLWRELNPLP
jgi:hypothetical protein